MYKTGIFMALLFFSSQAYTGQLDGLFRITGGFFATSGTLSGNIDVAGSSIQFDDTLIYGVNATFLVNELLSPGTYTRTYTTGTGTTLSRSATIPTGKTGAYFVIETNGNFYQLFQAWNVSPDGTSFTSTDFAGNIFIGGPLNGKRGSADFVIPPPPPPQLDINITVNGGSPQECAQTGGTVISATADVATSNGAVLDKVDWFLNNTYINTGTSTNTFIPLGLNTLSAVAIATDGFTTASSNTTVEIQDTLQPVLQIQFLDTAGNVITSAAPGNYSIHFEVSDICDPSPVISNGSAKPVMDIIEGDVITVNSATDVALPTTAIEVTATATDASGRSQTAQGTLLIE